MNTERRIVVAGGGAAGFFAAIQAAESDPAAEVTLYEATAHPLAKVRISGGGRCNVTHHCFEPRELVTRYPRGARELLGPFHRWGPRETISWFQERGVALKAEADGRMFPVTDDSRTIVECLRMAAASAGVRVVEGCALKTAERIESGAEGYRFRLGLKDGQSVLASCLLLATGGGRNSAGLTLARDLGHTIEPPVPSLFTFHIDDPRLVGLEGLAVAEAVAAIPEMNLRETGPVLITHWGLSGPAILRLSAWGARKLADVSYRTNLRIDWTGGNTPEAVARKLGEFRDAHPKRQVFSSNPFGMPARLWERLAEAAGLSENAIWASVSKRDMRSLAEQLTRCEFQVSGKSLNKEEFVTCGGVRLREVDFRTMESRRVPGLYFAGEILDIDGVTGGFNFQAAWTTGWTAGCAMASAD